MFFFLSFPLLLRLSVGLSFAAGAMEPGGGKADEDANKEMAELFFPSEESHCEDEELLKRMDFSVLSINFIRI